MGSPSILKKSAYHKRPPVSGHLRNRCTGKDDTEDLVRGFILFDPESLDAGVEGDLVVDLVFDTATLSGCDADRRV
jgi:hypothetical protein